MGMPSPYGRGTVTSRSHPPRWVDGREQTEPSDRRVLGPRSRQDGAALGPIPTAIDLPPRTPLESLASLGRTRGPGGLAVLPPANRTAGVPPGSARVLIVLHNAVQLPPHEPLARRDTVLGAKANGFSGNITRQIRAGTDVWKFRYRLPSGKDSTKVLGKIWEGRGRPPAGHLTEMQARFAAHAFFDAHADVRPETDNCCATPWPRSWRSVGSANLRAGRLTVTRASLHISRSV